MQIGTVDLNKLRGIGDKAAGLTKELVGAVTGNDRLQEAGEAQQERATEQMRALREELKAEGKDKKAAAHEQKQKAAERAKG